jgi:pyrimidine operon attenuation protein/uracil phosphoribosyltransferase
MTHARSSSTVSELEVPRAITRMAHEIAERYPADANLVLLGIPTRGVPLAERIGKALGEITDRPVPVGSLDVTMFRDDLRKKPVRSLMPTVLPPGGIEDAHVVMVDDVLFSGRTIRAALDAVIEFGRPRTVALAVLVDRGHRELPIKADFVGKNIPTRVGDQVHVSLREIDGHDEVIVVMDE